MTSTTSKKTVSSTKNSAVIVSAPKIANAWISACKASDTAEGKIADSILSLVSELVASNLSIKDKQKVIKATGKTSGVLLISHVEGLPTWKNLRDAHADFKALPLDKQLSRATAAYKMLGAGNAEQLGSWDAVAKATKAEKAVRNSKASAPKADKPAKPAKSDADTLKAMLAYFVALDLATLKDADLDLIAEIHATIENKVEVMA
jgi:hypothetical protein